MAGSATAGKGSGAGFTGAKDFSRVQQRESAEAPQRVAWLEIWLAADRRLATTAKPKNPLWISTKRVFCRTSLGLVAALTSGAGTMHKRSRLETQNPSSFLSRVHVGEKFIFHDMESL